MFQSVTNLLTLIYCKDDHEMRSQERDHESSPRLAAEVTKQNGTACIVFYSLNIVNIITNNIAGYCFPSSEVTGYKQVGLPSQKNNLAMWRSSA